MIDRRLLRIALVLLTIGLFTLPLSAQESTPEPDIDDADLLEVIRTTDDAGNVLTVRYPAEWTGRATDGQIQLGNDLASLADFMVGVPYSEGGIGGNVGAFPRDFAQVFDLPSNVTAFELIRALSDTLFADASDIAFDDPIPANINDISGALMRGVTDIDGVELSVLFLVLGYDDSFVFVNFSGRAEDMDANERIIFTIAISATFVGPEDAATVIETETFPQRYEYIDPTLGTVSFAYPAGWQVAQSGAVILANNEEALTLAQSQSPIEQSGQLTGQVIITDVAALDISNITPLSTARDVLEVFTRDVLVGVTLEEPANYLVNNLEVASVRGVAPSIFGEVDLWVFFVKTSGGFILLSFTTIQGEIELYEDAIFAIVGSVRYSADGL